jgi:hypothetical protein
VFEDLKKKFIKAPILATYDLNKDSILETNAFDEAIGGCLNQKGNNGLLYLIAYYSRKLSPIELNYDIYNKELLAIVDTIEH